MLGDRMSKVCETWSLEDLVEMSDADMEKLLGFYDNDEVPAYKDIHDFGDDDTFAFDGSFGWSI